MKEQATDNLDNIDEQAASSGISQAWLETLPTEVRSAPSLSKFKDVSALAQSYLGSEFK
jgi:hypothetical protein